MLEEVHMSCVTASLWACECLCEWTACECNRVFALETHFSACGPGLSCGCTAALLSLNASQETGRQDNYRDPHPIQMSIKLFGAWHATPPFPADREGGQTKREEEVRKEIKGRLMWQKQGRIMCRGQARQDKLFFELTNMQLLHIM